jgi:hypothetical protein
MALPQEGQNLACGGASAWHCGQMAISFSPQLRQNLARAGLSVPHLGHCMRTS